MELNGAEEGGREGGCKRGLGKCTVQYIGSNTNTHIHTHTLKTPHAVRCGQAEWLQARVVLSNKLKKWRECSGEEHRGEEKSKMLNMHFLWGISGTQRASLSESVSHTHTHTRTQTQIHTYTLTG